MKHQKTNLRNASKCDVSPDQPVNLRSTIQTIVTRLQNEWRL